MKRALVLIFLAMAAGCVQGTPTPSSTAQALIGAQPIAVDDYASTGFDTPVTVPVTKNDTGLTDTPIAVAVATTPAHGTAIANGDGTITYTPTAGYLGHDSFSYTVTDADGDQSTATVRIVVSSVACSTLTTVDLRTLPNYSTLASNVLPTPARFDMPAMAAGNPTRSSVSWIWADNPAEAADLDFMVLLDWPSNSTPHMAAPLDGVVLAHTIATGATTDLDFGTMTMQFSQPVLGLSFQISSLDGNENVVVHVFDDAGNDVALTTSPFASYAAPSLPSAFYAFVSPLPGQEFQGTSSNGFVYIELPPTAPTSRVEIAYRRRVTGGNQGINISAPVYLADACIEQAPVAVDDSVTTVGAVDIPVLTNDSDPNGDTLTIVSVTQPAHGTVTINPDGTLHYAPSAFAGTTTFSYTISDGRGSTATATVTVTRSEADVSIVPPTLLATPIAGQAYPSGQTVTCTNGSAVDAVNATCVVTGLPPGLVSTCTPPSPQATLAAGASIVCTVSGTPTTDAPIAATATTSADNDITPGNDTATVASTPTSNMGVAPTTTLAAPTKGQPYPTGQTVTCTNSGTIAAVNATCTIDGLPSGLQASCTPSSPSASLAPGSSIVCTVSGTPTTNDKIVAAVTTSADNDTTPGNNAGTVVSEPTTDVRVPASTTLAPPKRGQPYPTGQTVTCTNDGPLAALNATCKVDGLPSGLHATCEPSSPVASLAAGSSIVCTVSGTPTSNDPIHATVSASADNDHTPDNDSGEVKSGPAADMSVPATTMLAAPVAGEPYPLGQTVTCTNTGSAAATDATCAIAGLPSGLSATCTPPVPVASLPVGGSIVCTVSGTPTTNAPIDATITTGADNDPSTGNDEGAVTSTATTAPTTTSLAGGGFGCAFGGQPTSSTGGAALLFAALLFVVRRRRA